MNIEASKLELIKLIADEQSEALIERLRQVFKQFKRPASENGKTANVLPQPEKVPTSIVVADDREELWRLAAQPMPVSIDLEQLKKEQGYDPKKLWETLDNWDYSLFEDQSLEEMLNSLTP